MTPTVIPSGPVVVGVDNTDRSRDAIALGKRLALALPGGMRLIYVHTLEELDPLMAGGRPEEVGRLVAEDAQRRHEGVRALAAEVGETEVELVQESSPAAGLQALATESSAALLVIASSRQSGLGRVLPGGTAERLLSGSPVPVAVAPNGYAALEASDGVFGVGFDNSAESRHAVSWAAGLAGLCGVSLEVVAVHAPLAFGSTVAGGAYGTRTVNQALVDDLQSEIDRVAEPFAGDLPVEPRVLKGDPASVLVKRSEELDLLVLGSRGYGPVKSVLLGSVSSYVLRNGSCPVVVVPKGASDSRSPAQDTGESQ